MTGRPDRRNACSANRSTNTAKSQKPRSVWTAVDLGLTHHASAFASKPEIGQGFSFLAAQNLMGEWQDLQSRRRVQPRLAQCF